MESLHKQRTKGLYELYIKRILDIICSLLAIVVFSWLYILLAILVRLRMGSPVLFKQLRPGLIGKDGKEHIFEMYKFRTMSDERDENGNLLSDEMRMGKFGKMLRATSLDELPEAFNILRGDMSIIGPRPQLVKDMVFMTDEQRMRHTAKPGLSGLAQIMGRNAITWKEKYEWDLQYIKKISFIGDLRIIWGTVKKVFFRKNITESNDETDVTLDYGDALLQEGSISEEYYKKMQAKAELILEEQKKVISK